MYVTALNRRHDELLRKTEKIAVNISSVDSDQGERVRHYRPRSRHCSRRITIQVVATITAAVIPTMTILISLLFAPITAQSCYAAQRDQPAETSMAWPLGRSGKERVRIRICVASATSGQKASGKMRDFELLRTPRRRSEVNEQTRTSTIYG